MPTATVSTTEYIAVPVKDEQLADHLRMIESIYNVTALDVHKESTGLTTISFTGLDHSIRYFLSSELGMPVDQIHDHITSTKTAEIPFWNAAVMAEYLERTGWVMNVRPNSPADEPALKTVTFTRFTSPGEAVQVLIPIFKPFPDLVSVFVISNEDTDFSEGIEYTNDSGFINLGEIVDTAEKMFRKHSATP